MLLSMLYSLLRTGSTASSRGIITVSRSSLWEGPSKQAVCDFSHGTRIPIELAHKCLLLVNSHVRKPSRKRPVRNKNVKDLLEHRFVGKGCQSFRTFDKLRKIKLAAHF